MRFIADLRFSMWDFGKIVANVLRGVVGPAPETGYLKPQLPWRSRLARSRVTRDVSLFTLLCLFAFTSRLDAAYTYYYSDTFTSINTANWQQNGAVTATPSGLTATSANGGSLISKIAVPDGTSDYEVKTTLTLAASGGTYIQYVRATLDAMSGPVSSGTFYVVELQSPVPGGNGTLALYKKRKQ